MPKKLMSCIRQVMGKGVSKKSAYPICIKSTGQQPHHKLGMRKK